jgi:hypothetical protein
MNRNFVYFVCIALVAFTVGVFVGFCAEKSTPKPPVATTPKVEWIESDKSVQFEGKLVHPVYAFGGHTTGTVLKICDGGHFELELNAGPQFIDVPTTNRLLKFVKKFNGQEVIVRGVLKSVVDESGEVPLRQIIEVYSIRLK